MQAELQQLLDHAEEAFQMPCLDEAGNPQFFARNHCGDTLVHVAVGQQFTDSIRFLAQQGVDLDARGDFHQTAYFLACSFGHEEVAALLIELGANPNIPDHLGKLPEMNTKS